MSKIRTEDIIDSSGINSALKEIVERLNELTGAMDKTYQSMGKANKTSEEKKRIDKEQARQLKEQTQLEKKLHREKERMHKFRMRQRAKEMNAIFKQNQKQRELIRASRQEVRTNEQLNQKLKALRILREQVDRTTVAGTRKYTQMTAEIRRLAAAQDTNNRSMRVYNQNVGNYPKIVSGAIAAAGALIMAFRQVARHVGKAVNAFLIQQDITERVERQFGSYSDTIIKAAQETQRLTTVGDEQYMKLAVQAQNFGIANENVNKTVQDSIGLAEMFKDAGLKQTTAMKALALAQEGNYAQLQRYIPALRSVNSDTEKQALLNEISAKGFQMAQDNANTYAGRLQQIKNIYGDLQEEVGGQFLTGLFSTEDGEKVINSLDRIIEVLRETQIISEFINIYKNLFKDLFKPIDDIAQAFGLANDGGDSFALILKTLGATTKIAMLPLNILLSALGAITGFIKDLFTLSPDEWFKSFDNAAKSLLSPITSLGQSLGIVKESVDLTEIAYVSLEDKVREFTDKFTHYSQEQQEQIQETTELFLESTEARKKAALSEMELLAKSGASQAEIYKQGVKLLEQYNSETKSEIDNYRDAIKEITKKNEVLNLNKDKVEAATNELKEFLKQAEKLQKLNIDLGLSIAGITDKFDNLHNQVEETRISALRLHDIFSEIDWSNLGGTEISGLDKALRRANEIMGKFGQSALLVYETIDFAAGEYFANQNQRLADEQTRIDKYYDNQFRLYAEDADRLAQTKEAKRIEEEKLAAEQARIARQQAMFEKAKALFDIVVNTAVGVIKALAMTPPNPFLAATIGATGAVQTGIVAARPLPQYAVGLDKAKSDHVGFAGEEGSELMTLPDGSQHLIEKPSVVFIPKGSSIDTAEATQAKLRAMENNRQIVDNAKFQKQQIYYLKSINNKIDTSKTSTDKDLFYIKKYMK